MKFILNIIRIGLKKVWRNAFRIYLRLFFHKVGKNTDVHPSIEFESAEQITIQANCIIKKHVTIKGRSERKTGVFLGKGVSIREFSNIDSYGGYVKIHDYTAIGHHSFIGGQGGVEIGKYVMIGGYSYIISSNHLFEKIKIPFMLQGEKKAKIIIEDNVWVGAKCTILPGVKIGKNTVVGASSVVTKSFGSNVMIAGNPAKEIKKITYDE
ncbi:hypothetical protein HNS38_19770 [Lentimicrobium sp. L6]|uniref:acyltransferase n=1 Tax=Lentimicrobium sp. L6 TaxID=2735916 RepID=UPI00155358FA|nr:DapH/DapD/GlmU-related protein [Lentimicrobium sp. L6]NPD87000.1 hypothetical protein [Lentimicrobium sp. L6]